METVESVQKKINDKALKSCEDKVRNFCNSLRGDKEIWDELYNVFVKDEDKTVRICNAFFDSKQSIPKKIIQNLLPKAIEAETKEFFQKIENMQSQLDFWKTVKIMRLRNETYRR